LNVLAGYLMTRQSRFRREAFAVRALVPKVT
jgi:hypothetical protein